jgi:hypothetical protein
VPDTWSEDLSTESDLKDRTPELYKIDGGELDELKLSSDI